MKKIPFVIILEILALAGLFFVLFQYAWEVKSVDLGQGIVLKKYYEHNIYYPDLNKAELYYNGKLVLDNISNEYNSSYAYIYKEIGNNIYVLINKHREKKNLREEFGYIDKTTGHWYGLPYSDNVCDVNTKYFLVCSQPYYSEQIIEIGSVYSYNGFLAGPENKCSFSTKYKNLQILDAKFIPNSDNYIAILADNYVEPTQNVIVQVQSNCEFTELKRLVPLEPNINYNFHFKDWEDDQNFILDNYSGQSLMISTK